MAEVASVRAQWVCTALTSGQYIVMARSAAIGCLTVIKRCNHRTPYVGGVASLTQLGRQRMCGGFISTSADPVVAT